MLRRQQAAGKRLEGEGRKAALPEMEEVVAWIEGCRAKNFRVTRAFCRRPRIIAASFSRRKKLVAVMFAQGNTVCAVVRSAGS